MNRTPSFVIVAAIVALVLVALLWYGQQHRTPQVQTQVLTLSATDAMFGPSGTLVGVDAVGEVRVWDNAYRLLKTRQVDADYPFSLSFFKKPSSQVLVFGSPQSTVIDWKTGFLITTFKVQCEILPNTIGSLAVSKDHVYAVSRVPDTVVLRMAIKRPEVTTFYDHSENSSEHPYVSCIAASPRSSVIGIGVYGGVVLVDPYSNQAFPVMNIFPQRPALTILVCFISDGELVAVSHSGDVSVIDARQRVVRSSFTLPRSTTTVDFAVDRREIVLAFLQHDKSCQFEYWSLDKASRVLSFELPNCQPDIIKSNETGTRLLCLGLLPRGMLAADITR